MQAMYELSQRTLLVISLDREGPHFAGAAYISILPGYPTMRRMK